MILEVCEENVEKKEKKVQLKLIARGEGVAVVAVGYGGIRLPQGSLLSFQKNGTILRASAVNPDFGFQLDDKGRIKTN